VALTSLERSSLGTLALGVPLSEESLASLGTSLEDLAVHFAPPIANAAAMKPPASRMVI
jgi:hypothetical protein